MKMEPVEILLQDNKTFAQVAFLVDNPLFLSELHALRKQYKLSHPIKFGLHPLICHFIRINGGNPELYFKDRTIEPTDKGFSFLIEQPERLLEYLTEHQDAILLGTELYKKVIANEEQFLADITSVRRKYLYPSMFDSCVIQSLLFRKVKFLKTAYATYINRPAYSFEASEDIKEVREKVLAIIATPYSTKKDIMSAFRQGITEMRNITESTHPLNSILEKDTVSNIRRDRNWFWQIKNGKKYKNLADEFNIEQNSIEQAVSRYRKKIQFSPNS